MTGLGSTTWDAASVGDDDRNFYLWGAMGAAALVGLGLAIARPDRRVLVVTGDGEMLMGLGGLATIGVQRPPNLALAVFDNGHYGETGMQASHTEAAVELVAVARACGIKETFDITDELGLREFAGCACANRRRPCSPASRSAPTSRRGSCRRATASAEEPLPPRDRRRKLILPPAIFANAQGGLSARETQKMGFASLYPSYALVRVSELSHFWAARQCAARCRGP